MSELQQRASQHPGQLTSIMRTVSLDAPEGLRVALVIDGKVVMERTFSEPTKVTVGPAERDTFVLFDEALPAPITLFGPAKGGGFQLCIPAEGRGRIGVDGETLDAWEWRARGTERLRLSRGARGRLCFGRAAILFSYGPLPRVVAPAQLAPAMKRAIGIDWTTTIVAALSFLFHFGALGAIYSDWADPLVDEGLTISKLVESVRQLPAVPPVEERSEAQPSETAAAATTSTPSKDVSEKKSATVSGNRVSAGAPGSLSERDAKNLSSELASLDMQMLTGLNTGASTSAVLEQGNLPASLLDQAAMNGGSSRKPGQLDMSSSGGPDFGGPRDLAPLGHDGRGEGNRGPGTAASSSARPRAGIEPPPKPEGPEQIPGLEGAIARLQGGFRRCYQGGIDRENPDMEGGVRVTVKIGGNGDVMSASPSVSGNLSPGVVGCMVGKIKGAQFPKTPSGSPAVFVVPITVKKQ
jgi:hypothetical protein